MSYLKTEKMKTKRFLQAIVLLLLILGSASAQDKAKALSQPAVVWFGIDFTGAKFTSVTEDPAVIVNQYLNAINSLIIMESPKFYIKKYFKKSEVTNSIDIVNSSNSGIDPKTLVITEEYKIGQDDIKKIISKYKTSDNKGTGLVFIAENLNKITQTGSFYVCFFDIASNDIIDCERMTGKAAGFGFRNYWAGSVFNVMKGWASAK